MMQYFEIFLIIVLLWNWYGDKLRLLDFEDVVKFIERVKTFGLETLKVEEGHGGIKHFYIISFDQLLTNFECIMLLAFGWLKVHGSHEENGGANTASNEHLFK